MKITIHTSGVGNTIHLGANGIAIFFEAAREDKELRTIFLRAADRECIASIPCDLLSQEQIKQLIEIEEAI